MNNKGAIFSGFMYVLLTFFLLSLASLLIVLNNTKKISNKAREGAEGIIDNSTSEISITLNGSNVMCANIGQAFTEPGYVAKDNLGNNVPVVISSDLNVYSEGEYTITYTAKQGSNEKIVQRKIHVIKNDYVYTGNFQTLDFKCEGYYTVELWGAGHGNGMGAYTKGTIKFEKGEKAYLYLGQYSTVQNGTAFNGGTANSGGYPGGGATDLRMIKGSWNDLNSLKSRIMVAGGAGAGNVTYSHGGTLVGKASSSAVGAATGGTQSAPGNRQDGSYLAASFGIGGGGCGGGGGYYGAGGATCATGGAGGSSYISGYGGVNSITNDLDITHNSNTLHYSGKYFVNGSMTEGNNSGNGRAKIVYVGHEYPKNNTNFNNVRYVKSCANGSNAGGDTHWVELQVIKNGLNLALGKSPTATSPYHPGAYSYDIVTDGKADDFNKYASTQSTIYPGVQCITVDLGKIYDIDEVAVWHYYGGTPRTYNQTSVSLSTDNVTWRVVLSNTGVETPNGHRENAWGDLVLNAEVLIVAGGGGGGANHGGGGGAGGLIEAIVPLVAGTPYGITVGGGGSPAPSSTSPSGDGGNSLAFGLTAIGGGGGGNRNDTSNASPGRNGGSGGGGGGSQTIYPTNWNGGSGTAGQGNSGGKAVDNFGAGGGGAGGAGVGATSVAGSGGAGILSNISGSAVLYAGGGGGGAHSSLSNVGSGGSGIGGRGSYTTAFNGTNPLANTGSGGGGGGPTGGLGCAGASGIVIIRYPGPQIASGGTVTSSGGYTIHKFTTVGSHTFTTY